MLGVNVMAFPFSCFCLPMVLRPLSAGYNLYRHEDGFFFFFRNNFYIYLKVFKLWDFVVVVVIVLVVVHLSIFSLLFCSLLAMDKTRSFWPIKKRQLYQKNGTLSKP